jgi:hypothetical protein
MKGEVTSRLRARFWAGALISATIAAAGFWVGPGRFVIYAHGVGVPSGQTLLLCTYFALAWVAWFAACVLLYRWKALWLLLLAPFAILWPTMFLTNGLSLSELFHV